jgi:uncharacterized protein
MKIGITGASGFIGSAFGRHAASAGHEIVAYSRSGKTDQPWIAESRRMSSTLDASGCDALVHLAGESLLGYWTQAKKQRIWASRVDLTKSVVASLADAKPRPRILLCASGAGFYGDRGDEMLDESSSRGTGFLSEVCAAWESAAKQAEPLGVRVVHLRTGMVLGNDGGALALLRKVFGLGLGGRLGSGGQWMPWIHLEDQVRLMLWCIENANVAGPVNHVAPGTVTNREFTATLAKTLKRPAFFHAPAFALRLLMRQMADEMFLGSQRVLPRVALDLGFTFRHPALDSALASLLTSDS